MPEAYQVRNVARARQVVRVLVKHGFGRLLDRLNLEQIPGVGRLMMRIRGRPRGAYTIPERLRMVFEELGPTFVKLGQLLASRPDLVTPEAAEAFAGLRDNVPPFPGEEALAIVEANLPGAVPRVFSSLEAEPRAAASIAQVHYAELADGTPVAVKIRRPGIRQTVETDVNILFILARMAARRIPEFAAYDPVGVVQEFARTIRREMDFTLEGASIQRFADNFSGDARVSVPKVWWEATTPEVLTVERFVGWVSAGDPEGLARAGHDPGRVARDLVEVFYKQVLEDGFFHGDPHGGNLAVLPDGRIGFMDFGIVGQLDRDLRRSLVNVFLSLVDFDMERMVREYLHMGLVTEEVDEAALKRDLKEFIEPHYGRPLGKLPLGEILFESMRITLRHKVRIPPDLIMLAKAVLTLEGMARRLDPGLNLLELARPHAARLAERQFSPREIAMRLSGLARDYTELAAAFPGQLGRIMNKVLRGKLRIDFFHENLDNLIREMDRSANRISFSLVLTAIIIGSSLIIFSDKGYKVLGYPLLGVAGYIFAGVLGLWLVVAILRSGRL